MNCPERGALFAVTGVSISTTRSSINEIMKVALAAPTSFGHKPVEFVVARDKDMK